MRTLIVTAVGIALSGLGLAAQGHGDAAKGKTTFVERKCGVCHKTTKDDATGGKMSTVLGDVVGKMSDADIRDWLTDPAKMEKSLPKKPPMPMSSFVKTLNPPLSPAEISNLIAYLRTLPETKGGVPPSRP
jgi:cytochrome c2